MESRWPLLLDPSLTSCVDVHATMLVAVIFNKQWLGNESQMSCDDHLDSVADDAPGVWHVWSWRCLWKGKPDRLPLLILNSLFLAVVPPWLILRPLQSSWRYPYGSGVWHIQGWDKGLCLLWLHYTLWAADGAEVGAMFSLCRQALCTFPWLLL